MADTSNGLMYGVAQVKFKPAAGGEDKTLGWLDENGMQPAGNAPSFMDVYAAQVTDGPVDSIMTNPGSDAFTMNLIRLKAQDMVDVFGGKAEADGAQLPRVQRPPLAQWLAERHEYAERAGLRHPRGHAQAHRRQGTPLAHLSPRRGTGHERLDGGHEGIAYGSKGNRTDGRHFPL